jgi:hypothetical protein
MSFVIFAAVVTFVALSSMGKLDGVMGDGGSKEFSPQPQNPQEFGLPQYSGREQAPTARHASRSRH